MSLSIDRLRVWLLVGAALLVLVIAGFLGYARYRTHRFLAGLPAKLGIDIRRETNGYTYSQSIKGKTVMTLHAAKAVEHANGKLTLHDVGMILYGRKQDRADRISGSEFEYDQATGIVRAVGEVHIDLQAPSAADAHSTEGKPKPPASFTEQLGEESKRVIHVKTSGLVYLQKLGIAATDQGIEFKFGGMIGHAIGAEYNSDTGVLILQSAVTANGMQQGKPVVLTASHAELERESQQALLTQAKYVSPDQSVRGDHAIVHLRPDGSPERIEAEGNVVLEGSDRGTVTSSRADVLLNAASQAQSAHLFGADGVHFVDTATLRQGNGSAQDARVMFNATGQPEHVVLTGNVNVKERSRTSEAAASPWSNRDLSSSKLTVALTAESAKSRPQLREVEATSAARLTLTSNIGTPTASTSVLSGDLLHGHFDGVGKALQLSTIHGSGHTYLHRVSAAGAEQSSGGDSLDVNLRPSIRAGKGARGASTQEGEQIAKAVQTGHVTLTSKAAPGPKTADPAVTRATGDLSVYDGDADQLTLTGHAQVLQQDSTVSANTIVMEHANGDATATGLVKANYIQSDSTEPIHILADHAELKHAAGHAIFYGSSDKAGSGKPARLWQGASQVEAPVLDLEQQQRRLTAHGDDAADHAAGVFGPVHAVLVGNGAAKPGTNLHPSVVRIASRTMIYSDATRQVDFAGGVKVEDADGVLSARQATAYLHRQDASSPGATGPKANPDKSSLFLGGSVERIVANGSIEMDQPGRRAAGDQLVYTASDGLFVLTGTPTTPPRLIDQVQGTVTGSSLRFHTGDDSVMVTGGVSTGTTPGQRVHTVTRVKQK